MNVYMASRLPFSPAGLLFHDAVLVPAFRESGLLHLIDTAVDAARAAWGSIEAGPEDRSDQGWRDHYAFLAQGGHNPLAFRKLIPDCSIVVGVLDGTGERLSIVEELEFAVSSGIPVVGYSGDAFCSFHSDQSPVDARAETLIWNNRGCVVPTVPRLIELLVHENYAPRYGITHELKRMGLG